MFLLLKMREACTAKASHIFSTQNNGVFWILTFEFLTKRELTTSLVLNNRALVEKTVRHLLKLSRLVSGL